MNNWQNILDELHEKDNFRRLGSPPASGFIDLSSNDYLGLTGDLVLQENLLKKNLSEGRFAMSNPSSRLVTGNSADYDELEAAISRLYKGKAALVFGSGYLANSGILPAVTKKGDLVLADKLVHASIIDGLRLCECDFKRFRHNDLAHLEALLRRAKGDVWVVTESIFSMDGDLAPLREIIELKKRYGFSIYLDEAHAFGVRGGGAGYAAEMGLGGDVEVIIGTFGKALVSTGAFVATSEIVREVLINKMRTLIFSTALPPISLQWTKMIVDLLPSLEPQRDHLRRLQKLLGGQSQIIPIVAGSNAAALEMALQMREEGFWVMPIRYPTVPQGQARVRISLSAGLAENDIKRFAELCKRIG